MKLTEKAMEAAEGLGLINLAEAVHLSAICTHPFGRRRYEDWVFKIDGETVVDVGWYEDGRPCPYCLDKGYVRQQDVETGNWLTVECTH